MTKQGKYGTIRKRRVLTSDEILESCLALTRIFFGQEDERMARGLYKIARLGDVGGEEDGTSEGNVQTKPSVELGEQGENGMGIDSVDKSPEGK